MKGLPLFPPSSWWVRVGRFAARVSGLASGLARAVRPASSAETPGSTARRRRVPRSGMRSTVEAGGADPDNAWRSGPAPCDLRPAIGVSDATLTARPWCWRARQRDTAGTARGRSPGVPVRGSRRAVGLPSEGRGEKLPPRNGGTPGEPRPPTAGHPGCSSLSTARARSSLLAAGAVMPGAPKVRLEAVKKLVTAP